MLLEYFTKRSNRGGGAQGGAAFDINHSPLECGYCHTLSSKERYSPLRVGRSSPSVPKKSISRRHQTPNTGFFLLTCSSSNREAHQREQVLASMLLTSVTTEILAEVTFCKSPPPRHFLAPVPPLHNLCLNKYFKETTSFSRHLAQRMLRMYSFPLRDHDHFCTNKFILHMGRCTSIYTLKYLETLNVIHSLSYQKPPSISNLQHNNYFY